MDEARATPWNPDRRWADPLITLLLLASLLSIWGIFAAQNAPRPEPQRPGLQARAQELGRAALVVAHSSRALKPLEATAGNYYWDRALLALLAAERGDLSRGQTLAKEAHQRSESASAAFLRCWQAAYEEGPLPTEAEIELIRRPLGEGFAYWSLRARLAERASQPSEPFRSQARAWALPRLAALGAGTFATLTLGLSGLVAAGLFFFTKKGPRPMLPLPVFAMPWRALVLALLGWFLAMRASGLVAAVCLSIVPLPRIMALPIAYGFHVAVGGWLLLKAEGITLREARRRSTPGTLSRALGWAVPFLGIAIATVVLVGLLASPLTRNAAPPQRELMDIISGLRHPLAVGVLLLTIGGLAPIFEEWVFRGILLPWLGPRMAERFGTKGGWGLAILGSGLAFGAMHLQPAGLPTLASLGLVLGWAVVRTGNLWTAIAIHACWNTGVFLLVRTLA